MVFQRTFGINTALVSPPSRTNSYRVPIGLMCLSSALDVSGVDNVIVEPKGDANAWETTILKLKKLNPRFIGVTCLATEIWEVKELCCAIRQVCPYSTIILGGVHPTHSPQQFDEVGADYDYIILGEAEVPLVALIQGHKHASILARGGNKGDAIASILADLNDHPLPDYSKIDMGYYCRPSVWAIRFMPLAAVGVMGSRGCPYHCRYCVAYTVSGHRRRLIKPLTLALMVDQLVRSYNLTGFYWNDECFTSDKKWVKELCGFLNCIDTIWGCQTRAALLDESTVHDMKVAGCRQIDFGFETGSDRMMKVMNKGASVNQGKVAAALCKKHGIRVLANMMVNLPEETLNDVQMSVDFIKEIRPNVTFWNVYAPFPGVPFGREMDLGDLKSGEDHNLELLERKYKFGQYDLSLNKLAAGLRRITPSPPRIVLSWHWSYYAGWFRFFSFVFQLDYWRRIWFSKRRWQYFSIPQLIRQLVAK